MTDAPDAPIDLDAIRKRLAHVIADDGRIAFLNAYLEALATRDVPALLDHVTALQTENQRLKEGMQTLEAKWRSERAHTYASENADHYRGFDAGRQRSADELATLRGLTGEGR